MFRLDQARDDCRDDLLCSEKTGQVCKYLERVDLPCRPAWIRRTAQFTRVTGLSATMRRARGDQRFFVSGLCSSES
jgi:hypothetical protein